MAQATTARRTRDGSVGKSTFDAVEKLVARGMSKKHAFGQVARRERKSVSAVQSAYYSTARRRDAGAEGSRQRPEQPVPIDRLANDLVTSIQELGDVVKAQQAEIEGLQGRMAALRTLF
jgi:hypothetical protein